MRYRTKYHSTRVDTTDGRFDSKKEYKRWLELRQMQRDGIISDLNRQVPFELIPRQLMAGKVVERAVKYFADFTYKVDGVMIVEDTKGLKTADYIIKRKLMLYVHGIRIKEV